MKSTTAPPSPPGLGVPPRLFARLPTVLAATGLGRSTIYRLMGPRAVAWRWSDLDQWTRSRPGKH
jgi:predicted DNA-binding transcriptional regulator AlpA